MLFLLLYFTLAVFWFEASWIQQLIDMTVGGLLKGWILGAAEGVAREVPIAASFTPSEVKIIEMLLGRLSIHQPSAAGIFASAMLFPFDFRAVDLRSSCRGADQFRRTSCRHRP
jgi:hypothetical protein